MRVRVLNYLLVFIEGTERTYNKFYSFEDYSENSSPTE